MKKFPFYEAAIYTAIIYLIYLIGLYGIAALQNISFLDSNQGSSYISLGLLAADKLPIYLPFDSARRISHLYGPLTFLPLGYIVQWFDNPAIGAHIFGWARGILTLILFAVAIKRVSSSISLSIVATTCIAVNYGPDLWNYLQDGMVSLGLVLFLFALTTNNVLLRIMLAATGVFIAFNAKATALLYFMPLFYYWYLRTRANIAEIVIVTIIVVLATLLLFAYPSFSFTNYWEILTQVGANRKVEFFRIGKNFFAFITAFMPLIIIALLPNNTLLASVRNKTLIAISIIVAIPLVFYIAALDGANPNHVRHLAVVAWVIVALNMPISISPKAKTMLFVIVCIVAGALQENIWRRQITPWLSHRQPSQEAAALSEIRMLRESLSNYSLYSTGYCHWVYECPKVYKQDNVYSWVFRGALHSKNHYYFIETSAAAALDGALRYRKQKAPPEATWETLRSRRINAFVIPVPAGDWKRTPAQNEWAQTFRQNYVLCKQGAHYELFCASDASTEIINK